MKSLKLVAIAGVVVGLAVLALAVAPSVYGQSRGRDFMVLAGRGAEIGVRVTDAPNSDVGGVRIEEVEPNSPAEKAGLKRDDVIVEFDGERVRGTRQFARLVQETPPGRTVKAGVMRGGRKTELQITPSEGERSTSRLFDGDRFRGQLGDQFRDLDRLRDLPFNFSFDFNHPGMASSGRLGVTLDELTHQLADYFGVKDGVLVTSVADGSPASRAGIKAGDVITSINGARVASRDDLLRGLREADGDEVSIGIVRDKKESTVKATIEAPRRSARGARPAV